MAGRAIEVIARGWREVLSEYSAVCGRTYVFPQSKRDLRHVESSQVAQIAAVSRSATTLATGRSRLSGPLVGHITTDKPNGTEKPTAGTARWARVSSRAGYYGA